MIRRVMALVAGFSVSAGPALAICPYPTPRACSAYFESDVVFVGSVLSRGYSGDGEYLRFGVRVSRILRGSVGKTAVVYSGNDSGRLLWDVGEEYVVFANRQDGRLLSGGDCGPLSDPAKVAETIREIEGLGRGPSASIEGEVRSGPPDRPGLAGVAVRIRGGGRTYALRSDSRGSFRVEVPPGRYKVLVDPTLRRSDYNSTDLNDIRLVRGQCAQLQLVPN